MHKSPLVALGFWSIPQENWHWEGPENIVLVTQNAAIGTVHSTSTLLNSPETRHSICTMHNHEPASMNQRLKLPGSYSF